MLDQLVGGLLLEDGPGKYMQNANMQILERPGMTLSCD